MRLTLRSVVGSSVVGSNKEMKQTRVSVSDARSQSPVVGGPRGVTANGASLFAEVAK
jgi:hypothetical protein